MSKQIITNTDLINNYIDFGSPLNQVMLITAMNAYVKQVTENEALVREQMSNSIIHPDSWIESARAWVKAQADQLTNNDTN